MRIRKHRLGWIAKTLWLCVVLVAVVLGWLIFTTVQAGQNIFTERAGTGAPTLGHQANTSPTALTKEGDGRITILVLGRGGENHPGGLLTDSIQLVSVDPITKQIAFLSLPRDLLVRIPGDGFSKLNSVYSYAEQRQKGSGPKAAVDTISQILDLPIHYYIDVDFQGFKDVVDSLGGIQVDVKIGFTDPLFPDDRMVGYKPFSVKAGLQTMDGTTALKYARSRHGTNGEGSDFARSHRQQEIIKAIKDKSLTVGTLANPIKLNDLIRAVGNHLHTDITPKDAENLVQVIKGIQFDTAKTQVIDNSLELGLLVDGKVNAQYGYHLLPKLGSENYLDVQRFTHSFFPEPYLIQENATVQLVDATGNKKTAADVQKTLKAYGYNVLPDITSAPTQKQTSLVDHTSGKKPYTKALLEKRFKTTAQADRATTSPDTTPADFDLVIGSSAVPVGGVTTQGINAQARQTSPKSQPATE